MKIARRRQATLDNGIEVVGPAGPLAKKLPSTGAALVFAQFMAQLASNPIELTVTEYDDVIYRVTRDAHGIILTTNAKRGG